MSNLDAVLNQLDADQDAAIARLFELLKIESISTDPAFAAACKEAADHLVADLKTIGFDAARRDTPKHPMVVAHSDNMDQTDLPHVLFYGHYDVQPVDPLDLWNTSPFDPHIDETPTGPVIRARGASDDKGQVMTFVEACRAYKATGTPLPCRITLFFEGEEESGSPSLIPFMKDNTAELSADLALVCDTSMWDEKTPAITTSLRGMVAAEITITGPSIDLHSGLYGGAAINPIRVLTRLLGGLHDDTGRITLPRFYDGVDEVPADIKAQWDTLGFDDGEFLGEVGLSTPAGEQGYSALEQIWARPTCDINGITGGYTGEGFKTVLPSKAHAKVSFRLVGKQDPAAIDATLKKYIAGGLPPDCEMTYTSKFGSATVMATDSPPFTKARKALSDEWPNEAVFVGGGGSIPVVGHIKDILGIDSMLVGFGLNDDAIHSPNEKYNVSSFQKGARSWARILSVLGR